MPIVFFLAMWSPMYRVFSLWLELILANCLTLLIYMSIKDKVLAVMLNIFDVSKLFKDNITSNFFVVGTNVFIVCLAIGLIVKITEKIAHRLANVTLKRVEYRK